jgi:Lysine methyltransferase
MFLDQKKIETMTEPEYDAADAMLSRGAYLRKLREMETQDEAEREAGKSRSNSIDEDSKADTLHYESQYLQAGQQYHDDYKHVNYRFIDFGFVNNNGKQEEEDKDSNSDSNSGSDSDNEKHKQMPLIIEQDRSLRSKGGMVWDAGFILAEHVIHEQEEWKLRCHNKHPVTMVELGAGTGITGLIVASTFPEDVHMSLTDLPLLMPLLQKNLERNQSSCLQATAFPLAWGTNVKGHYDVILGADVVAGIYDPIKLAQTIADLCHDHTLVYITVNSRLTEIIATFEVAMNQHFEHIEHRAPVSRNKNPNVSILVATGKRLNQ